MKWVYPVVGSMEEHRKYQKTRALIGIGSHPVADYLVLKAALLNAERSILRGTR